MKSYLFPLCIILLITLFLLFPLTNEDNGANAVYQESSGELLIPQRNTVIAAVELEKAGLVLTEPNHINRLRALQQKMFALEGVSRVESLLNASMVISRDDDIIVTRAVPDETPSRESMERLLSELFEYPELIPYVNRDKNTLLIYIYYGNNVPARRIYQGLSALRNGSSIPFEFTGRGPIVALTESLLTDDIVLFFPLLIIMVVLVFSLFKRLRVTLLSLLLIFIAIGAAYSFIRFLGFPDSPLILLIPVFSLGLLSDYLIHFFYHNLYTPHGADRESLRRILLFPLSLTALSTITGFLSLSLINGSGHVQLGFVIAMAVVLTWAGIFVWLTPCGQKGEIKPLLPRFQEGQVKLFSLLSRFRILFFLLAGLGVLWGGITLFDLTIEPYPVEQLPGNTTIKEADRIVNEEFYGTISFFLELDTGEKNGILKKDTMLFLDDFHRGLEEHRAGYSFSLLTVLKRMSYYWEGSEEILTESDKYDDFYDALIEQYLLYYSSSVDPLEYESMLDNSYRVLSVKGLIFYESYEDLDIFLEYIERVRGELPEGWTLEVHGMASQLEEEHDNLRNNWVVSFVFGSFLIFVTVLIFYRKPILALLSLVPGIISMIISFGFISMAGISIDAFSIVFVAIITGLVIDYSIHTLSALEHLGKVESLEEGFSRIIGFSGVPIVLSFLTSLLSFSVLFFSSFRGARSLGFLLLTSLILSVILSLYLIPLIILPLHLRRGEKHD